MDNDILLGAANRANVTYENVSEGFAATTCWVLSDEEIHEIKFGHTLIFGDFFPKKEKE